MCVHYTDCTGRIDAPGTRDGVNWNAVWTVSADSRSVMFTVTAQTAGWVAIGFSLNQAMVNNYFNIRSEPLRMTGTMFSLCVA